MAAQAVTDKPSLIILKTIIGWPSPKKQNTGKIHGSALGADELRAVKEVLGFDPEQTFEVADEVIEHTRKAVERGAEEHAEWQKGFDAWAEANPERKQLLDRLLTRRGSRRLESALPVFEPGKDVSTRAASGKVHQRDRPGHARAVGRLRRPRRVEQHHHRGRRVVRAEPSARPTSGPATRTAACCTSASASTPWPRSSTASCCTARPARSAARS